MNPEIDKFVAEKLNFLEYVNDQHKRDLESAIRSSIDFGINIAQLKADKSVHDSGVAIGIKIGREKADKKWIKQMKELQKVLTEKIENI